MAHWSLSATVLAALPGFFLLLHSHFLSVNSLSPSPPLPHPDPRCPPIEELGISSLEAGHLGSRSKTKLKNEPGSPSQELTYSPWERDPHHIFPLGPVCSVTQGCWTPRDHVSPLSSVHGMSQARILEWVAISYSRQLPNPGIEPTSPALADGFFTTVPPG